MNFSYIENKNDNSIEFLKCFSRLKEIEKTILIHGIDVTDKSKSELPINVKKVEALDCSFDYQTIKQSLEKNLFRRAISVGNKKERWIFSMRFWDDEQKISIRPSEYVFDNYQKYMCFLGKKNDYSIKLSNYYSIYLYNFFCKIIESNHDFSNFSFKFKINLERFKISLNLGGKYIDSPMFVERVIKKSIVEINNLTDITIKYIICNNYVIFEAFTKYPSVKQKIVYGAFKDE